MSADVDQALWVADRAAGVVALVLLSASVLIGILAWSRWQRPGWPRFLTSGLHRNVALLTLAFIGVHAGATVLNSTVDIGPQDVIVPFAGALEPFWLGLGTLALDALLAATITALLVRRLGWRTFRAVHWVVYGAWPLAMLHTLAMGTDRHEGWLTVLVLALLGTVAGAVAWRAVHDRRPAPRRRAGLSGSRPGV